MMRFDSTTRLATRERESGLASCALSDPEKVICHCLQITAAAIDVAIVADACRTVRDVVGATTAGTGCTACHRHIRAMLEAHERPESLEFPRR